MVYEYNFCMHQAACIFQKIGVGKKFLITTNYPAGRLLFFAGCVLALGLCAGALRRTFPRIADWSFAILLSAYLYKTWPHMFFDDAGFIMRYLDQLKDGYWFQYNGGEGAVFGISGFIHGLYCSLLVKITGMSAERALHFSNLTGLALTVYFMAGIFRYFLQRAGLAYLVTFLVVCYAKSWADVLFTGMETPLHVALVMGAFYFLVYDKARWFYLFVALALISKLDAVPVMAVLVLCYALKQIGRYGLKQTLLSEIKPQLIYFWLPLLVWIAFSTWLFGGPFPQSAKAKMLYHSGANHAFFPFLEGFSNDVYKLPLLYFLGMLFIAHIAHIPKKGWQAVTLYFGFGWMFVAIMALYYFYNPNERMLWYYALPELLLVAQCVFSSVWIASEAKDWRRFVLPAFVILGWIMYLKPDVDGGKNWMFSYLEKVERERYEIGKYIAEEATPQDTLLAWHGLIARPFPGFVLDGTGLNSKLAVEFKLNRDSMISVIQPDFGMHHGYPEINESFAKNGYRIKGMFGDVTLENWPAWIWWEKIERNGKVGLKRTTLTLVDTNVVMGRITNPQNPLKVEGRRIVFTNPVPSRTGSVWFIFEGRENEEKKVHVKIWRDTVVTEEKDILMPRYAQEGYPSLYTYGTNIVFDRATKIEFIPTGKDTVVKINNPVMEYMNIFYNDEE